VKAEQLAHVSREGLDLAPSPVALERERDDDVRGEHERAERRDGRTAPVGSRHRQPAPARARERTAGIRDPAGVLGEPPRNPLESCLVVCRACLPDARSFAFERRPPVQMML
jgi:hypothetical protein